LGGKQAGRCQPALISRLLWKVLLKAVSETSLGKDMLGIAGIGFDLLA
jgi:hypothetical protein